MLFMPSKYFRFAAMVIFFIFLILSNCAPQKRYQHIIPVTSIQPMLSAFRDGAEPNFQHMLDSFQQIGDITTMTYHGDFDALIAVREQQIETWLQQNQPVMDSVHCSIFAHFGSSTSALMGRNFDNIPTDILVGFFLPDSGYASVAFSPLTEFGFTPDQPLCPDSVSHKQRLLMAAAVPTEGMNEKGLALALATNGREKVTPDSTKKRLFLTHLVRKILDHTATVAEAAALAAQYNIFDNGRNLICHHILVADAHGKSIVLEWSGGEMRVIPNTTNWQAVTNSPLFGIPENVRANRCGRYARLHRKLPKSTDAMLWQQAMDLLSSTAQHNRYYTLDGKRQCVNTEWSAIFDLVNRQIHLSLDMDYQTIYSIGVEKNPTQL